MMSNIVIVSVLCQQQKKLKNMKKKSKIKLTIVSCREKMYHDQV